MAKKTVDKQDFVVTFYSRHAVHHPIDPKYHPDGYVKVTAPNKGDAEYLTRSRLGDYWKEMFSIQNLIPEMFPRGEIDHFVHPIYE